MSATPNVRRRYRVMADEAALAMLRTGYCGRLATVGPDGCPYCVPLLHVWQDGQVYVHTGAAHGHLAACLEHNARVCFEVDEPGEPFGYGRFECDTALAYRSVIVFGTIELVADRAAKQRFCDALMAIGRRMTREPVRVNDAPGFLVNQVGRGFNIEAAHMVQEGVADTVSIDRIMRDGAGFRMGPFQLMDLTGPGHLHMKARRSTGWTEVK